MRTATAPLDPQVGDFLAWTMVTDTVVYEVVKTTASTITVRRTRGGDVVRRHNVDGDPYPLVYTAERPDPTASTRVLRRRADGTFRVGNGANPMRPAITHEGVPVSLTDYRM